MFSWLYSILLSWGDGMLYNICESDGYPILPKIDMAYIIVVLYSYVCSGKCYVA